MVPNFLQKPFGAIAVLAAAVGGPYAAFETNVGTNLRRTLMGGATSSNQATPDAYGSNALASNGSNWGMAGSGSSVGQDAYSSGSYSNGYAAQPPGQPISVQYGPATIQPMGPPIPATSTQWGAPYPPGSGYSPTSYSPPASSYGPGGNPYPQQAGAANSNAVSNNPWGANPNYANIPRASIETRQGPSSVVDGGTQQLWDYTLGVPTLQQLQQQSAPVAGGEIHDLREVLRFDITPGWLPQRFARVTTVLSNVQLDGLRVPLITGTKPTDLAGTLTYYFDASQSLRRINLHGLTGDPSQLANLMVQYYGLQPEQMLGGQLMTTRWNNRIANVLQIAPAPIIYAGADHSKYIVFLELNQAGPNFGLSQEASELLQNSQATRRW